jgi:D-tyrosyl-tRNA(Tyr) deacylase
MAALLVVAIVSAMAPPRALPSGKIHPFYLSLYFGSRPLGYRVFPDDSGRMNRSLAEVAGGLLLVSQFTLAADTDKGTRASFSAAAPPDDARRLFDYLVQKAGTAHPEVATGEYGAHMEVALVNDGPVTFRLRVRQPDQY